MDGLLTAEEFAAEFDESVDDGKLHAEYRRLAAEQAALRRLATLVARGVEPLEVFGAVAEEMRRCVPADTAGLWRFETERRDHASWPPTADPRRWRSGRWAPELRWKATPSLRWCNAPAGPRGSTATTTSPGRSPLACARWACARRWECRSSSMDACGAWRPSGSVQPGPMPADTEVRISRFAELIATALVAGYRDEQKRQLLAEGSQRANLIDALLEGRAFDEWSLREVAGSLRLPINGPFVVVAAHVPTVGDEPLREIESKLRSLDIFSAWRLLPDVQVGIVHVKSDQKLDVVVALMSRTTTARVGVSAAFGDLRDTPQALHVARMMLRGPTDSTSSVAVFDGSILATAAVSAPQVMVQTVGAALDGFGDLPDDEREMLFETFRVWQDTDASVSGAADRLLCHPNTVRHRLRRIEKRTGRSLSRPRDVAELCLAFEVHRRLM